MNVLLLFGPTPYCCYMVPLLSYTILLNGPTPLIYSCCIATPLIYSFCTSPLSSFTFAEWPHSPHILLYRPTHTLAVHLHSPHLLLLNVTTPLIYSCCIAPLPSCTFAILPHSLIYAVVPHSPHIITKLSKSVICVWISLSLWWRKVIFPHQKQSDIHIHITRRRWFCFYIL